MEKSSWIRVETLRMKYSDGPYNLANIERRTLAKVRSDGRIAWAKTRNGSTKYTGSRFWTDQEVIDRMRAIGEGLDQKLIDPEVARMALDAITLELGKRVNP